MEPGDWVWIHSYGKWRIGKVVAVARKWATVSYVSNRTTGRVKEKPFPIAIIRTEQPEDC